MIIKSIGNMIILKITSNNFFIIFLDLFLKVPRYKFSFII